jgi:hypothetical protein
MGLICGAANVAAGTSCPLLRLLVPWVAAEAAAGRAAGIGVGVLTAAVAVCDSPALLEE